jgi:hypothetical protein
MNQQASDRRLRGGIIMAELGARDLGRFLEVCRQERRTTGFLGGRIISDWLKSRGGHDETPGKKQAE